jgi:plastocyanin
MKNTTPVFLLLIALVLIFKACDNAKQSPYYEQADKGFTTSDLDEDQRELNPKVFRITYDGNQFDPSDLQAEAGQMIRIVFENQSDQEKNLVFMLNSGEVKFDQPVAAGELDSMKFTVPIVLGDYPYYTGENSAGELRGSLKVTDPGETETAARDLE